MGMKAAPRRVTAPAATTRERLIDAAADVIAEEGYDRAGVQEIARRAGLTNGAIYANFRDRSELLAEAIESGLERLLGQMDEAEPRRAGATAGQVIELVGRTLALHTPDRSRTLVSEALAAARRDPDVGERVRQLLGTLETRVAGTVAARGAGPLRGRARDRLPPDVRDRHGRARPGGLDAAHDPRRRLPPRLSRIP
jgi:AcrR family transcriptional regulator